MPNNKIVEIDYDKFFDGSETPEQKKQSIEIMKQAGCVPPKNCANCTNCDCYTIFRPQMSA